MSISSIVTMGYGNGTFAPGVAFIPTIGYSISEDIVVDLGDVVIDSHDRPTVREGGTLRARIDLRNDLDEGDVISTVSIAELVSTDLTITAVAATIIEKTIAGRFVPAGRGIEFFVSGHVAATGSYRLRVTFSTAGGITGKAPKEDFVFDVAP